MPLAAFPVWTDGSVQIEFSSTPFAESRELREELRQRINEAVPDEFFRAVEWAFGELRRAHPEPPSS